MLSTGKYWDRAWSLIDGCTQVSPGCDHCWLRDMDRRFHPENLQGVKFRRDRLLEPTKRKKPTVYAVWSDLFHEDIEQIEQWDALSIMGHDCPQHTFLILTKRPEVAVNADLAEISSRWPFPNIWLGVTAENQEQADKRIPILLQIPAAVRGVSVEPMLGPVKIINYLHVPYPDARPEMKSLYADAWRKLHPVLDLVICGGETGPGARPMHPDWARSLRDQCQTAGVPFFFKQWGEWSHLDWRHTLPKRGDAWVWPDGDFRIIDGGEHPAQIQGCALMRKVGKKLAGRLLNGREWSQFPKGAI